MRHRALAGLIPALALSAGLRPEPVTIAFAPEPGAVVERAFDLAIDLRLVDLRFEGAGWRYGRPWPGSPRTPPAARVQSDLLRALHSEPSLLRVESAMRTTDEYVDVTGGRPLLLRRSYDRLDVAWGPDLFDDEVERLTQKLLYRTVLFEWDEALGRCTPRWERGRDDPELLRGLTEDMDYRALLPDDPVEVGERWSVPWRSLGPVLVPGGRAPHLPEEPWGRTGLALVDACFGGAFRSWVGTDDIELELVEILDRDGERCARISIAVDRWGRLQSLDLDALDSLDDLELLPDSLRPLGWADADLRVRGSGELLWNLAAGRTETFTLALGLESRLSLDAERGVWRVDLEGQARWSAAVLEGG